MLLLIHQTYRLQSYKRDLLTDFKPLQVPLGTLKVVAADDQLPWIKRTVGNLEDRLVYDIIGILAVRAVAAPELHSAIMRAYLVLVFAINIGI